MITLICGTNRPGSNTRKVVRLVEGMYTSSKAPFQLLDLADLPQEIFVPSSYGQKPRSFQPFADAILKASGVHIVTPEYNGGMPGILKYFIDMLKFPESFEGRPVCFTGLSAGVWGALRPVEQLQAIFMYRNAHLFPQRVFLPGIHDLLDDQGRMKNEELFDRLRKQVDSFIGYVERLHGVRLRAES